MTNLYLHWKCRLKSFILRCLSGDAGVPWRASLQKLKKQAWLRLCCSHNELLFCAAGGGLAEITLTFDSGRVMYGFCGLKEPTAALPRYILINWVSRWDEGETGGGMLWNVLQCYKWEYQSHRGSLHIFNLVVYLTRTRRWERSKTRRRCSLSSWKKSGIGSGRRHADVTKCCDCSESVRSSETRLMYQICLAVANQPTNCLHILNQSLVGQEFTEASCFSIWA